ncbi:hypothetical protein DD607_32775 [Salmonella sp. 3DZ2-4SM]|nr:hypothetical protein DD607_32775 [Salmonella sp. 3DZ2-4SM]
MTVEIKGVQQLVNQLEKKFGVENTKRVNDQALKKAGAYFEKELSSAFETFKDTGASKDEIQLSEPMMIQGVRGIKVYWEGPMDRYRLIHLNEWGYTRNGIKQHPRGYAVIAKTLKNSERVYRNIIKDEIRKNLI